MASPERPRTPSQETRSRKTTEYFTRVGMRFRKEFKILDSEEFRVGIPARREGWFISNRALVEAVLAEKIAELATLSDEERKLLTEAALLSAATKRSQYEATSASEITSEELSAFKERGEQQLLAHGVDPRAIEIMSASGTEFFKDAARGNIQPTTEEESKIYELQRYFGYLHNLAEQTISRSETTGAKEQETNITDWRQHLEEAAKRYPDIAAEKEMINGREMSYFDIEGMIMEEVEGELAERIRQHHPDLVTDETPLWEVLRNSLEKDIEAT